MEKSLREALEKISEGMRNLAVVIDTALTIPTLTVETKVNTLSEAFDQLLSTGHDLESKVEELESKMDDLPDCDAVNDQIDERLEERVGDAVSEAVDEIDIPEKITSSINDYDFLSPVDTAVREVLKDAKVRLTFE